MDLFIPRDIFDLIRSFWIELLNEDMRRFFLKETWYSIAIQRNEAKYILRGNLIVGIEDAFSEEYYLFGKLHRTDGPAIEFKNGTVHYYSNGLKHRNNGPATIFYDGHEEYFEHGVRRNYKPTLKRVYRTNDADDQKKKRTKLVKYEFK